MPIFRTTLPGGQKISIAEIPELNNSTKPPSKAGTIFRFSYGWSNISERMTYSVVQKPQIVPQEYSVRNIPIIKNISPRYRLDRTDLHQIFG